MGVDGGMGIEVKFLLARNLPSFKYCPQNNNTQTKEMGWEWIVICPVLQTLFSDKFFTSYRVI